jgi:hypothetical protein
MGGTLRSPRDGSDPSGMAKWEMRDGAIRGWLYGSVSFIDEWIGIILATMEEKAFWKLMVVYLSDHGDMTGDQLSGGNLSPINPPRIPCSCDGPASLIGSRGKTVKQPVDFAMCYHFNRRASISIPDFMKDAACFNLRGVTQKMGTYIDLEHDICSITNLWERPDGRPGKIYIPRFDGREQLFYLVTIPVSLNDLSSDSQHNSTLRNWRTG